MADIMGDDMRSAAKKPQLAVVSEVRGESREVESPYWTVKEAARVLKVAECTVREYIRATKKGKMNLPFCQIGREYRLPKGELIAWIDDQR